MSYLVFARKYRPQTFVEILGQGPIVTTLTNAIRQRRIGHAYLFTGPRGTGKTSTARIFAKALNCVEGPTPTPCLSCERCQEVTQGRSLDVLEIDGASNRGIDQIRALREHSKFTPASGTFKVYIIDEVHQITAEGFNALLKILEEPPIHVLFILATTAPHKVPATILSRCQRYDFKRLPTDLIVAKVKTIAQDEKLHLEEDAAIGIARAASGSLRDAESILDQLASFASGRIRGGDLKALLGTINEDIFAEAMAGIQARDPVQLLKLVADAVNAGTDLTQWTLGFLSFLRNLLVVKVGAGPLGFEDLGPEALPRLTALAKGFSLEELTAVIQVLTTATETIRRVAEPRIPLEVALIRLSAGEPVAAVSDLLEQLQGIEQRLQGAGSVSESPPPASGSTPGLVSNQPPAPAAAPSPAPARQQPDSQEAVLQQVAAAWPALLEQVRQQKVSTAMYLGEGRPVTVEQWTPLQIVVGFPKGYEFHRDSLDKLQTKQMVEQMLAGLLGFPIRCVFRVIEGISPTPRQESASARRFAPQAAIPQDAPAGSGTNVPEASPKQPQADPSLVDSAVDMFEGRILPGGA